LGGAEYYKTKQTLDEKKEEIQTPNRHRKKWGKQGPQERKKTKR